MKQGVLLVNLGSPDSPSVLDVRRYLREFLMDGRVLDSNWLIRKCVVELAILPTRPAQSAEAYHKVWTDKGSPLVSISRAAQSALQQRVAMPVELAMRYQNPSIADALAKLEDQGIGEVLVIALFPHYAMSSFESAVERVKDLAARHHPAMRLTIQPPFYEDPDYLDALVARAQPYLAKPYDHLLFSFHGLPERHMRKADPTRSHCMATENCCETATASLPTCYRAQCFRTVAGFVKRAGIPREKYTVAFQSRLGREPWLRPYTDEVISKFPAQGVRELLVMCPAFVSDCLETLEEIGMRGKESFIESGGKNLTLIPCLNEHPLWIQTLEKMVRTFLRPAPTLAPLKPKG